MQNKKAKYIFCCVFIAPDLCNHLVTYICSGRNPFWGLRPEQQLQNCSKKKIITHNSLVFHYVVLHRINISCEQCSLEPLVGILTPGLEATSLEQLMYRLV